MVPTESGPSGRAGRCSDPRRRARGTPRRAGECRATTRSRRSRGCLPTVGGSTYAVGDITNTAGTGEKGFSGNNGPAIKSKISRAYGVAVDSSGNVYIADFTKQPDSLRDRSQGRLRGFDLSCRRHRCLCLQQREAKLQGRWRTSVERHHEQSTKCLSMRSTTCLSVEGATT